MKKVISIVLSIGLFIGSIIGLTSLMGCDELPTVEQMTLTSTSIGYAAGYACEIGKIDDNVRNNILTVLDTVAVIVPTNGQSFAMTWSPIIKNTVENLVKNNKINEKYSEVVIVTATAAATGLDYIFTVKYPQLKATSEIVNAAINGFMNGFKTVIKPNDVENAARTITYDVEAYKWFKTNGPKLKNN